MQKPDQAVTREALLAWFQGKVSHWWIPDDVVFVEQLPRTATGKVSKAELRRQYRTLLAGRAGDERR